jgi:CarD family transcriptional regulator
MPKKKAAKAVAKSAPTRKASVKSAQPKPSAKAAVLAKARKAGASKAAKPMAKPAHSHGKKAESAKAAPAKKPREVRSATPVPSAAPRHPTPTKAPAPSAAAPTVRPPVPHPQGVARSAGAARAMPAAVGKPAAPKLTAPITPKQVAEKAAAARHQQLAAASSAMNKKPVSQRHGFKTNEFIVYPAHGVGRIVGIEEQEIAGISLELFVIQFEKDKMTLRVPTGKSQSVGMRKLSEDGVVKKAMETLKGKARIKRTMWSRRAQEYEAKINSGDLISIAEVVRDLYRSDTQPEQSYSERQLYEAALDRMAREIAAVDKLDERGAMQRITEVLSKSAKGRRLADEASAAEVKAA